MRSQLTSIDLDGGPPTYALGSGPMLGALVVVNSNGTYTYTPAPNYNGPDSFTFTACDGALESGETKVAITVLAIDDPPVAGSDFASTSEETPVSGNVVDGSAGGADGDIDNDPLTATLVRGVSHGLLVFSGNGNFTDTPALSFDGTDTFTYKVSEGCQRQPGLLGGRTERDVTLAAESSTGEHRPHRRGGRRRRRVDLHGDRHLPGRADQRRRRWQYRDRRLRRGHEPGVGPRGADRDAAGAGQRPCVSHPV